VYKGVPLKVNDFKVSWNKHELLNNDLTIVVMFLAPVTRFFSSREDSKIIRDMVYNSL
jgi:hypothetical protein